MGNGNLEMVGRWSYERYYRFTGGYSIYIGATSIYALMSEGKGNNNKKIDADDTATRQWQQ